MIFVKLRRDAIGITMEVMGGDRFWKWSRVTREFVAIGIVVENKVEQ